LCRKELRRKLHDDDDDDDDDRNAMCRKCFTEEEISAHILYPFETLVSLRHLHLSSLFVDPEDIRKLNLVVI